jgi:hypothetical protein
VSFAARAFPCGLLCQHVKERASRTQNESSLSSFAEAKPLFEAQPQRAIYLSTLQNYAQKRLEPSILTKPLGWLKNPLDNNDKASSKTFGWKSPTFG